LEKPALLFGHHLDLIILCCIYAVCSKLTKSDLRFRNIIQVYTARWDKNSESVIRAVPTKEGPMDIIKFYNAYFIPQVRTSFLIPNRKQFFLLLTRLFFSLGRLRHLWWVQLVSRCAICLLVVLLPVLGPIRPSALQPLAPLPCRVDPQYRPVV
jgi:hypothetical protein